jgi:hypothetical protein
MKATKWLKEHFEHLKNDQEKMSWNQIIDITTLACDIEKKSYNKIKARLGDINETIYFNDSNFEDMEILKQKKELLEWVLKILTNE